MPKLPQVSGQALVRLLEFGYALVRQRGSHAQMRKHGDAGEHTVTIPMHDAVAKGTLNDILSRVSVWNGLSKPELLRRLQRYQ